MPQTVITLYARPGCHLCENAKEIILELKSDFFFHFEEINIDESDELTEVYGLMIPVVLVNGQEAGYGQINKMDIIVPLQKAF